MFLIEKHYYHGSSYIFHQSLLPEPLSTQTTSMQVLKTLWEKTQVKGSQSFEESITQSMFPHKKVIFIEYHFSTVGDIS